MKRFKIFIAFLAISLVAVFFSCRHGNDSKPKPTSNECTVTFNAEHAELTAVIEGKTEKLTSPAKVKKGAKIVFTAEANEGYEITKNSWTGVEPKDDDVKTAVLTVTKDTKVKAIAISNECTVTFNTKNASLTAKIEGETENLTSPAKVKKGTKIVFTAEANEGYEITEDSWTGVEPKDDDVKTAVLTVSKNTTIKVTGKKECTITFSADHASLTAKIEETNETLTSPANILEDTKIIFTAEAETDYEITKNSWTGVSPKADNARIAILTVSESTEIKATATKIFSIDPEIPIKIKVAEGTTSIEVWIKTQDGSVLTVQGCEETSLTSDSYSTLTLKPDTREIGISGTNITWVAVYSQNIVALDVSKCGSSLTLLYCWGNQLTQLNLENNIALTYLYCDGNQLTQLNLKNNTALTRLECQNNQLTQLNLENNTALTRLECYNNQLTQLNLENNTALTRLECWGNQLTELNLENNTALTRLECYNNQLTQLNLENKTALTTLECASNQLTQLNLGDNTALTYLNCAGNQLTQLNLENNTALTTLYCAANQLTQLNLENNIALTRLNCGHNKLTQLSLGDNTVLTRLECWRNQLTQLNLKNNTALTELKCYDNQLTQLNLENNTALTRLSCGDNQLTQLNLKNNTALTELYCGWNQLTQLNLRDNTALTRLYCYDNQLTQLNLGDNTDLAYLYCYTNKIKKEQMLSILNALSKVTSTEEKKAYLYQEGDENYQFDDAPDGDVTTAIESAKAKGWKLYKSYGAEISY